MLVSRFLILLGIYVVQSFAQYYIRDWLGIANAATVTGNLMAAIGVAITVLVFPAGWLSDKIGRWSLNIIAGIMAAVGIALPVFARSVDAVSCLRRDHRDGDRGFRERQLGVGHRPDPARRGRQVPRVHQLRDGRSRRHQPVGGPLIDGINAIWLGSFAGYPVTFGLAAVATLCGRLATGARSAAGSSRRTVRRRLARQRPFYASR